MTAGTTAPRLRPPAAPVRARRPRPGRGPLATAALAVGFAVIAAGCLPSGSRGSGRAGGGSNAAPAMSTAPSPTGPTPRPSFVPPTPTPAPTFLLYVVAKGDSLNTIAHKFGTTARSIAFWNRATYPSLDPESAGYRPDLLKLGWTLSLVPNLVVDEQDLPEPSASTDPTDPAPSDDTGEVVTDGAVDGVTDGVTDAPSDSPIPE